MLDGRAVDRQIGVAEVMDVLDEWLHASPRFVHRDRPLHFDRAGLFVARQSLAQNIHQRAIPR